MAPRTSDAALAFSIAHLLSPSFSAHPHASKAFLGNVGPQESQFEPSHLKGFWSQDFSGKDPFESLLKVIGITLEFVFGFRAPPQSSKAYPLTPELEHFCGVFPDG